MNHRTGQDDLPRPISVHQLQYRSPPINTNAPDCGGLRPRGSFPRLGTPAHPAQVSSFRRRSPETVPQPCTSHFPPGDSIPRISIARHPPCVPRPCSLQAAKRKTFLSHHPLSAVPPTDLQISRSFGVAMSAARDQNLPRMQPRTNLRLPTCPAPPLPRRHMSACSATTYGLSVTSTPILLIPGIRGPMMYAPHNNVRPRRPRPATSDLEPLAPWGSSLLVGNFFFVSGVPIK